jgi:hypothetical protein
MSHQKLTIKKISRIPAHIMEMLGPPLVLPTEDLKAYKRVILQIANSVKPRDLIQWWLVADIAYYSWEVRRLRRIKFKLVEISRSQLTSEYINRKREDAGRRLKVAEIHEDALIERFTDVLPTYAELDRLLARAESTLAHQLRELAERDNSFASRLHQASDDVIDAEIIEESAGPAASARPATCTPKAPSAPRAPSGPRAPSDPRAPSALKPRLAAFASWPPALLPLPPPDDE